MRLAGKTALITGSTYGMGATMAQCFAAEGAAVVVSGRTGDAGEEVAAGIRQAGGRGHFVRLDVADEASVEAAVAETVAEFGGLHVLVNNAAATDVVSGGGDGPCVELATEAFDQVMKVGVYGTFWACKYAIPALVAAGGGSIVNISSAAGSLGVPHVFAYSASKGALNAMTRQLALQYGKQDVRVNTITVGFVISGPVTQMMLEHPVVGPAFDAATLVPRRGRSEDVASCAMYLASDEARFVTGADFTVDGGTTSAAAYPDPRELFLAELESGDAS